MAQDLSCSRPDTIAGTGISASASSPDSSGPSGIRASQLVLLAVITSFGPLSMDLYLPSLPDIRVGFGASDQAAQLTVTTCIIGLALGQLVAGVASDAVGRRRPLLIGMAGWSVTTVLCAFAPSLAVLTGLRFVQGLGAGIGIAIARSVISDLDPHNLVTHLSRMFLVLAAVPVLAPAIGGVMLGIGSWRDLFGVLAAVGAAFTVLVMMRLPESLPARARSAGAVRESVASYQVLGKSRGFMLPVLVSGVAFGVIFSYIGQSPFLFRDLIGLSAAQYGIVFGINAVGLIAGMQLSSVLVNRIGARTAQIGAGAAGVLAGIGLLVFPVLLGEHLAPIMAPLFVALTATGILMPASSAEALDSSPRAAGGASGLMGALQFCLGGVIGAFCTPALLGPGSRPLAIVVLACSAITCLVNLQRRSAGVGAVL